MVNGSRELVLGSGFSLSAGGEAGAPRVGAPEHRVGLTLRARW